MKSWGIQTLESMSQAEWYNRWTLKKFTPFLKGDILEVGCGIGNFTNSLMEYGKVWAIDIDPRGVLETAENVLGRAKIGFGDIENNKFFFGNKKFDTIVCMNVLEHIKDDIKACKNLYKLLKIGGFLIVLVPSHPILSGQIDQSIGHFRRYSKNKLNEILLETGLKIIKSRRLNFLGSIGWFIAGRILREDRVDEDKVKIFNFFAPTVLKIEDLIEPPIGTSILTIAQKKA